MHPTTVAINLAKEVLEIAAQHAAVPTEPGLTHPKLNAATFKGNKQFLPSKPCAACGRTMTWRKKWAKSWGEVKYCSDACRRKNNL